MSTIETENRTTISKSICRGSIAVEKTSEIGFTSMFESDNTTGVGLNNVCAVLRKLCVGFFMRAIDNHECCRCFFGMPSSRITDLDTSFSTNIGYNVNWTIIGLVVNSSLDTGANYRSSSLSMTRTSNTVAGMIRDEYFNFNNTGTACSVGHN